MDSETEGKGKEEAAPAAAIESYESFEAMGLKENIERALYTYGFESPSEIQKRAIVPIMRKFDLIAQSQSGCGKTCAFVVGTLERVDPTNNTLQAIIITSTRDLAIQIHKVITELSQYIENLKIQLLIGAGKLNSYAQYKKTEANKASSEQPHIIVCSPGRLCGEIKANKINLRDLELLTLDEADNLLEEPTFQDQLYYIITSLHKKTNIALFSATFSEKVLDIANRFMRNPVKILVPKEQLSLKGISQFFIDTNHQSYRYSTLIDIFSFLPITQTIIFVNSKRRCEELYHNMTRDDFVVSYIHGELEQSKRTEILQAFTNGESRVLIATDIISRGFDARAVSLVINYELPRDKHTFIHRCGRGSRWGRKSITINLITPREFAVMREIESYYDITIEPMPENLSEYTVGLYTIESAKK